MHYEEIGFHFTFRLEGMMIDDKVNISFHVRRVPSLSHS